MLPGTHFYSSYSYSMNSRFIHGITVIPGIIYSSFQKPAPESLLGDLGGLAFLSHCRYDINLIQLHNLPPFYRSVLKYWQDYRSDFTEDNAQIQNEIIWNSSNILINKNTIFFKQLYQNGIIRLQDLLAVDCTLSISPKIPAKIATICSLYHILWTVKLYPC